MFPLQFLDQLTGLLKKAETRGSVYLTQKKFTEQDGITTAAASSTNSAPLLIFRATDGNSDKSKKIKFSTVVGEKELEGFWSRYSDAIKGGVVGLKKKEKKKKAKGKKGVKKWITNIINKKNINTVN